MWKSGILLRAPGSFYPQGSFWISTVIHSSCEKKVLAKFIHKLSFHIPQALWNFYYIPLAPSQRGLSEIFDF
jgi:hypothetical protein